MFKKVKHDNTTTLYKIRRGKNIPVCSVIDTIENRLLVTNSTGYKFKQNNKPVKFKRVNGTLIAVVNKPVKVYKKPHHAHVHKTIMQENSRRLWSTRSQSQHEPLDHNKLIDNLLEFIARV